MLVRDYLDRLLAFPPGALVEIVGPGGIVVLSPHPDDESLGCGGLIAAARASGRLVTIVTLTDGSGSHPHSLRYASPALAALRSAESITAAAHLGVPPEHIHELGLRDTAAPSSGPDFDAAVERIVTLARSTDAGTLLVTSGFDPHCDHEAADLMARAVVARLPYLRLWFYPIWSWHRRPDEDAGDRQPVGLRLDITDFVEAKRAAIAAHVSQMTDLVDDDPAGFRFTPETLAPFLCPFEIFIAP